MGPNHDANFSIANDIRTGTTTRYAARNRYGAGHAPLKSDAVLRFKTRPPFHTASIFSIGSASGAAPTNNQQHNKMSLTEASNKFYGYIDVFAAERDDKASFATLSVPSLLTPGNVTTSWIRSAASIRVSCVRCA